MKFTESREDVAADLKNRRAEIDLTPDQFRRLGHDLVDRIAELYDKIEQYPVTRGYTLDQIQEALQAGRGLPDKGTDPGPLLARAADLLVNNSLFIGHPRFWGYITSSAAPLGMLGDLLAAGINPNMGAWKASPMGTEIELQTLRWIAELIEYPTDCGGILVSGGNMANFIGFLAARTVKIGEHVRTDGFLGGESGKYTVYVSAETHTWIHKAADLFGLGTNAVRWIETDEQLRLKPEILRQRIETDIADGFKPFLVVGTAGSVSTGAIDPLHSIHEVCREFDLWFHVDGAYGAPAVLVAEPGDDILGLSHADSVALDPHKWLYAPLEAGCALVRDPEALRKTFSYHPAYYHFGNEVTNLVDFGPQNSRGFRALKVWLTLQQVGREGYRRMIGDDIRLARSVWDAIENHPELERRTQSLSITTFRYIPSDLRQRSADTDVAEYLNELNEKLLGLIETSGEMFLSNAVVDGRFLLRMCIVNFRSSLRDVDAVPEVVCRYGSHLDGEIRPEGLRS